MLPSQSGSSQVNIQELIALSNATDKVKKKLEKLDKSERKLGPTISKPQKERLERSVNYESAKELVGEWQPTVQMMRQSESLQFPLPELDVKTPRITNASLTSNHKAETDLESKIESILVDSGINEKKIMETEQIVLESLSPEEIRERRAQLARARSLLFYQEIKNKRKAKIKSKKFRKMERKKKEKMAPTLEELQELDPEKYKEELHKREMIRLKERMLLKHKHNTKWAKFALKSSNPVLQRAAQDHLRIGRDLLKKMNTEDDDDEEIEEEEEEEEEQEEQEKVRDIIDINGNIIMSDDEIDDDDEVIIGRKQFSNKGSIIEEKKTPKERKEKKADSNSVTQTNKKKLEEDSECIINTTSFDSSDEDDEDNDDDDDDLTFNLKAAKLVSDEQRELINRAFAADHITEEQIAEEKRKQVEEENDVEKEYASLIMPGWGEWAGNGLQPSNRRKRLIEEMERKKKLKEKELLKKRKDANLKHAIINEKKPKHFLKYTLEEAPYPFTSKDLYEKTIRQPLGKEWNTYSTHKALIRPKVVIKSGSIIEPIKKKRKVSAK